MAKYRTSSESETKNIFERGILSRNPVLVYAIGICPLIAVAKSAATACVLAILSAVLLIALEVLTALIIKKIPKWLRIGVYALLGVLIIIPFYMLMGVYMPSIEVSLGIYIPLLAVNSLTVQRCEAFAVKHSVKYAFLDAVANSIGYAIPLILTGMLREALGSSRIFGYYIDALPRADGFLMPFCGFIILGFVAAFINFIRNKFRIGEEFDTKGNDFVVDKQKDKAIDEDEESIQNEITVVPENIPGTVAVSTAVEKMPEASSQADSSANFEASVSRIIHKWASGNDSEISSEINVPEEKTEASEKTQSTDTQEASITDKSVAGHPVIPTESTEAPAPKKTTRKRTAKKTSEVNAKTDDMIVSVSDTVVTETAKVDASTESAETPAPKKTTRKRTAKKAAEVNAKTDDMNVSVADTVVTETTKADASTESAETPAPKKTTRKRTAKKAAEVNAKTDDMNATAADTVVTETTRADAETPAPKKTTRKRTAKKAAEVNAENADTNAADTSATKAAEADDKSEEVPAPKKTTRKRTTSKTVKAAEPTQETTLKED